MLLARYLSAFNFNARSNSEAVHAYLLTSILATRSYLVIKLVVIPTKSIVRIESKKVSEVNNRPPHIITKASMIKI